MKDVNDLKYAARTRAEAKEILAKEMAFSASLSDESIDLSAEEDTQRSQPKKKRMKKKKKMKKRSK